MGMKSTALGNYVAVTGSLKVALDDGFLFMFSGPVPASADAAIDGSSDQLVKLSVAGDGVTGLTFEGTATGGVLTKTAAEAWKGTIGTSGDATFFRFCEAGDDGSTLSTTAKRVQGTIGTTVASDIVLTSTALVSGQEQDLSLFQIY